MQPGPILLGTAPQLSVCLITLHTCGYTTDLSPYEYEKMAKEREDETLHDSANTIPPVSV
jgi:hypothetical protein